MWLEIVHVSLICWRIRRLDVRILDDLIAKRHANEANSREMQQIRGGFCAELISRLFQMIIYFNRPFMLPPPIFSQEKYDENLCIIFSRIPPLTSPKSFHSFFSCESKMKTISHKAENSQIEFHVYFLRIFLIFSHTMTNNRGGGELLGSEWSKIP